MSCPSEETRLAELLGELSVNRARELVRHRAGCAACTRALRDDEQLLSDLAAVPEFRDPDEAFTAKVMRACEAAATAPTRTTMRRSRLAWSASALVAVAAASWLLIAPRLAQAPEFQARGTAERRAPLVSVDVLFLRDKNLLPLTGAQLRSGDALAVRFTNASELPSYLAVFALDADRELHWIYPAYSNASEDPSSVLLPSGVHGQLLDQVVEPEAPATGTFEVFAVSSAAPLHVKQFETLRSVLTTERIKASLGASEVQSWRATWNRD